MVVVREGGWCGWWLWWKLDGAIGGGGEGVAGFREGRERGSEKVEGVVGGRRKRSLFIEREMIRRVVWIEKKGFAKLRKYHAT